MTTARNATRKQQDTSGPWSGPFRAPGPRRSADAQLRLLLDDDDLLTVHLDGAPVGRRLALRLGGAILTPLSQLLFEILLEHLSLRPPGALPRYPALAGPCPGPNPLRVLLASHERFEDARPIGAAELPERLCLDLADALAGDGESLADLLERVIGLLADAE